VAELPLLTKIEVIKSHISLLPKTGGFSLNLNLQEPKTGYLVGGYSDVYENPCSQQIERLLKKATGNYFVGGWIDDKTGKVYVERSRRFDNKDVALGLAHVLKQIAIFDVENKETIYL